MSETDATAIQVVKDLQGRIQKWVMTMVGIFALALISGVFWGGTINNQVKNNTETGCTNSEDIKELTKAVNDYFTEQKVNNTNYVTKPDLNNIRDYWSATDDNLDQIIYWARTRGFDGVIREIELKDINRN